MEQLRDIDVGHVNEIHNGQLRPIADVACYLMGAKFFADGREKIVMPNSLDRSYWFRRGAPDNYHDVLIGIDV